ncbi:serine/threonine-protein kinase [Limnoglobus roseus]|uniref:Serine/threonine protein kinase n=1 Tax=Limnoglobus roseus TaxID=2598579 RepID=A0A5C1A5Q4_9BACT|nr:serine/threonine-protein kinase [Limnoglobus roseus]QEL13675.1 serine/threonine protein kinase [Limnoglobus roseus]
MTRQLLPSAGQDFDDPRVVVALERYLEALEAGRAPDRDAFLREHSDIADVLEECLSGLEFLQHAAPKEATERTPERLDEYRILREVGRGGMGVVYEAERTTDGRRVAVKTLPLATGWQPIDRERFRNEARAVGMLDHPNIVPILAVGCDRGIHYFVMPLIVGSSLAILGDPDHAPAASTVPYAAAGDPRPDAIPLPTPATELPKSSKEIVRLIVQAAEALAHAHDRGIVHRDVKPANCLVDAHGHLWVVDFGLARLSGATRLTRTGAMVGTLQYMAPEQLDAGRGIVDQRTDLYSLGATLYELLTRRPLFAVQDRGQFVAAILNEEPRPPRAINPMVPYDLETITLKLLAKEPSDRYPSAETLIADFKQFLAEKPIAARRPSRGQRMGRWMSRHRGLSLTAAAAVFGVLVLQGVNTVRLMNRESALLTEREVVRTAVDEMYTAFADRVLSRTDGLEADQRDFLVKARDQYTRLAALEGANPGDQLAAARSWRRVGDIDQLLGDPVAAEKSYRESQAILTAFTSASTEVLREVAATANNLGNLYRVTGRTEAADESYATAAATLRTLSEAQPATAEDRFEAAGVEHNRGLICQLQDRHRDAVERFRAAQTRFAQLATEFPNRAELVEHTAFVGHNLGVSLHCQNQDAPAADALRESLLLWEKAQKFPQRPPETRRRAARTRLELARVRIAQKRPDEAQALAEQGVTAFAALASASPRVPRYRLDEAVARLVLAESLATQDQRPAARRELDRARESLLASSAESPSELATAYCLQAQLDAAESQLLEAAAAVRQAEAWAARIPQAATAERTRLRIERVRDTIREHGGHQ